MNWKMGLLGLLFINSVSAEVFFLKFSGTIIGTPCPVDVSHKVESVPIQSFHHSECVPNKTKITPIYKIEKNADNEVKAHIGDILVVTYY